MQTSCFNRESVADQDLKSGEREGDVKYEFDSINFFQLWND